MNTGRPTANSLSNDKLGLIPSNFRDDFDFLEPQQFRLIQKAYSRYGKKFLELCYALKNHFETKRILVQLNSLELEKLKAKLYKDKDFLREAWARYEEYLKQGEEADS